jgi:hypothetical protein
METEVMGRPPSTDGSRQRKQYQVGTILDGVPLPSKTRPNEKLEEGIVALKAAKVGSALPVEGYSDANVRKTARAVFGDEAAYVVGRSGGKLYVWKVAEPQSGTGQSEGDGQTD